MPIWPNDSSRLAPQAASPRCIIPGMSRCEQRGARAGSGFGWFVLGTAIGLVLSTAAVVLATELTRKRYYRDPQTGELVEEYIDPFEAVVGSIQSGMHLLAETAVGVTESFSEALREKIRFGLNPVDSGGGEQAWFYDEDEA